MKKFLLLLVLASAACTMQGVKKEMGKPLEPLPEGRPTRPEQFATHPIMMIIDYSEKVGDTKNAMSRALTAAVEAHASIVITTPNVVCALIDGGITPELTNTLSTQWIFRKTKHVVVLIPRSFRGLHELRTYDAQGVYAPLKDWGTKESKATTLELLLGIAVDHLEKFDLTSVTDKDKRQTFLLPVPKDESLMAGLGKAFVEECKNKIFVPREKYAKGVLAVPRFAFLLEGHGLRPADLSFLIEGLKERERKIVEKIEDYQKKLNAAEDVKTQEEYRVKLKTLRGFKVTTEESIARASKLVVPAGEIAGLSIPVFSELLDFFGRKLTTSLVFILSCLAGGRNLEEAFLDTQKMLLKSYPFVVVVAALTEAPIFSMDVLNLAQFFGWLTATPELPDLKALSECLVSLSYYPQMTPLVKFPWSDQQFQVLELPGRVVTLGKTLAWAHTGVLDVSTFFGGRVDSYFKMSIRYPEKPDTRYLQKKIYPHIILLYQGRYPFWIKLTVNPQDRDRVPRFISMAQGPFRHEIDGLDASDFWLDGLLAGLYISGLKVDKQFYFKEVKVKVNKPLADSPKLVTLKGLMATSNRDGVNVFFELAGGDYWSGKMGKAENYATYNKITPEAYAESLKKALEDREVKSEQATLPPAFKTELSKVLQQKKQRGPLQEP